MLNAPKREKGHKLFIFSYKTWCSLSNLRIRKCWEELLLGKTTLNLLRIGGFEKNQVRKSAAEREKLRKLKEEKDGVVDIHQEGIWSIQIYWYSILDPFIQLVQIKSDEFWYKKILKLWSRVLKWKLRKMWNWF